MYIMAPDSARRIWFCSSEMVTIWDSEPSILDAMSKFMGVASTPSEARVCVILLVSLVFFWGRLEDDVALVECARFVIVAVIV